MTYYALSNINHNGVEYTRGRQVHDLSEAEAEVLLNDEVISDVQPTDVAEDTAPLEDISDEDTPVVGGAPSESGEPSLDQADASGTDTSETDAEDVTNEDGTPKTGFLSRLFGKKGEAETITLSEEDIAAHPVLAENGFEAGVEYDAEKFTPEMVEALGAPADVSANL